MQIQSRFKVKPTWLGTPNLQAALSAGKPLTICSEVRKESPQAEKLIAASVQWAEKIIDVYAQFLPLSARRAIDRTREMAERRIAAAKVAVH